MLDLSDLDLDEVRTKDDVSTDMALERLSLEGAIQLSGGATHGRSSYDGCGACGGCNCRSASTH